MRATGYSRAGALLCLCLLFNSIAAELAQPARREESTLSTKVSPSKTLTNTGNKAASHTSSVNLDGSPADATTTSTSTPGTTSLSSAAPYSSIVMNGTLFESPVPEDDLPLDPQITPGFAVAGVILVCTGVIYALVGIKTRWIHSFLSTAFLGSLGTSVLIVYVMTPPVGNAIQGAYVVAVTCTGLILGGLAIVFKEITECLACLLGGFCLSMWLLTLQPGGVIRQTGGKVGFIAAFSLAGFGLYFTPWTRNYGMITCISFAGATVAVLGIDCFSRAGYKEFWAYIWALNDDLFPLGTTTYPLTRGIRVEIAVTILIFLAGVVSQLKLWRIIRDRRNKRDAERAEGERTLRAEEENVGRQIEAMTARERRRWERIYGDGAVSPLGNSADSGVGDMESEKRIRHSSVTSALALGTRSHSPAEIDPGRMLELSLGDATAPFHIPRLIAAEQVISKDDDGARVTVMVAQDDVPTGPIFEQAYQQAKEVDVSHVTEPKAEYSIPSAWRGSTLRLEVSPSITPLPFTVPEEPAEERTEEERSSIATFADEDEPELRRRTRDGLSGSVVRRLSNGSAKMFRSLSQRNRQGQRNHEAGDSRDELVELPPVSRDESDSVAANLDDLSYVSDLVSFHSWDTPRELELDAKLDGKGKGKGKGPKAGGKGKIETQTEPQAEQTAPLANWPFSSRIEAEEESQMSPPPNSLSAAKLGLLGAGEQADEPDTVHVSDDKTQDATAPEPDPAVSIQDGEEKSLRRTSIDSVAASLTRGNLPSGLSRVAMSYRTNEWAKHLSVAETPEPETLQAEELVAEALSDVASEGPAPLDVMELQQTAENAAPPPAAPRSASAMSNYAQHHHTITRSSSRASLSGYADNPTPEPRYKTPPYRSVSGTLKGKASGLLAQPIAEEGDEHNNNNNKLLHDIQPPAALLEENPMAESSSRYNTPSPGPSPRELSTSVSTPNLSMWLNSQGGGGGGQNSSPQTLMGMREMLLRTKASAGLLATPEAAGFDHHQRSPSEAGSVVAQNFHTYPHDPPSPLVDADDIPLSRRRAMIRQSSCLSFHGGSGGSGKPYRSQSRGSMQNLYLAAAAEGVPVVFDSHQPVRGGNVPAESVRQAQLANFRSSVAADLGGEGEGRNGGLLGGSVSMGSLRGAYMQSNGYGRESAVGMVPVAGVEVQRSIDTQRSFLLGQKEAEMARREAERVEVERGQREFDEQMRSGAMMGAHRDAMRRMQARARE